MTSSPCDPVPAANMMQKQTPNIYFYVYTHTVYLQGRPDHQCAAQQFWLSCWWHPGRTGLSGDMKQQLLPPVRLLLYRLTAESHRSQRPAVWSLQAMNSFGETEQVICVICSMSFTFVHHIYTLCAQTGMLKKAFDCKRWGALLKSANINL